MTTTVAWSEVERLPDGHRLFFYEDMIAIADNSGRTPEVTDDGLLWLDFSRPLSLCGRNCFIPINDGEREFATITDFTTVLMLSERYEWPISNQGVKFIARLACSES
jgi:hypothetical protein